MVKPTNVFNRSMIGVVRVQLTHGKVVLSSGWCQIGLAADIVDGARINGGEQHGHSRVNDPRHTRDCLVIAEEGLHQQHREGGVRTTSAEGSSGEGLRRDAQNTSQATARE